MSGRSFLRLIPWALLGSLFALLVLYPVGATVARSLHAGGGVSIANYAALVDPGDRANIEAVGNSLLVSLLSVAFSGALGLFLAFVFTQFRFPLRSFLGRLAVLPVALPPIVGVIAFLFVFGETGIIPRGLQMLTGSSAPILAAGGIAGILLVHVYSFHVYFYLFASAALAALDASQLEAADGMGSGPWRTFRTVLLPALRPGLLAASALTFMSSMASFTAPLLFAGGKHFLTLQIYATKLNGDLDLAAAQSVFLTCVSLAFYLLLTLGPARDATYARKGVRAPGLIRTGGAARRVMVGVAALLLALEMLPVAAIVSLSFAREGSWTTGWLPSAWSTENYAAFLHDPGLLAPLANSLVMAALALAGSLLFGVAASIAVARWKSGAARRWAGVILTMPYAVPGTVVAVSLILAFNRPLAGGVPPVLVGTFWILPLAYFVREYPVVVRSVSASLEAMDASLLEAAAGLGAGTYRRFRFVVLPAILPAMVSGGVLVAIASLGEFVSSVLLYAYGSRPVSVEILAQLRLFNIGGASALSVILMGTILLLLRASGGLLAYDRRFSYVL